MRTVRILCIVRWTRRRNRAAFDEFAPEVREAILSLYAARSTGIAPTLEELPPVLAVRSLIADTVAQLELVAVRSNTPVRRQPALVVTPDVYEPRWLTMHRLVMQLTGRHGGAWLMVTAFDPVTSRPLAVRVLDGDHVTPDVEQHTGRVLGCTWDGRSLSVDAGDVVYVPLNVTGRHGSLGSSPLRECRPVLESLAALYRYAGSSFAEFGAPSVKLKVPHRLSTKAEADELRDIWLASHGGKRVPAVLHGGADVEPFHPEDPRALVEALEAFSAEVARAYRVPPHLVNARAAGASQTYSTTEGQFRFWLATGLGGYLTRIEAAFTAMLPAGTVARFDTSELLRSDVLQRTQADALAIQSGIITPDEARAARGLPPLGTTPPAAVTAPALDGV